MKIGLTGATGFIGQHLLKDYAGSHTFIAATSHADDRGFYRHSNIRYVFSDYSVDSYRSIFAGCDCIGPLGRCEKQSRRGKENGKLLWQHYRL